MKCPKCKNVSTFKTERRPNGNTTCLECDYKASSADFLEPAPFSVTETQEEIKDDMQRDSEPEVKQDLTVSEAFIALGNGEKVTSDGLAQNTIFIQLKGSALVDAEGDSRGAKILEPLFGGANCRIYVDEPKKMMKPDKETISIVDGETLSIISWDNKVYEFESPHHSLNCELLKAYATYIVGKFEFEGKIIAAIWGLDGKHHPERVKENGNIYLDLIPIKSKWYEDESNFPALITNNHTLEIADRFDVQSQRFYFREHYYSNICNGWRLTTKQERDSLYCEEK